MIQWREYEGGIELYYIAKGELKGWLPMALQNYLSEKVGADLLLNLVDYY